MRSEIKLAQYLWIWSITSVVIYNFRSNSMHCDVTVGAAFYPVIRSILTQKNPHAIYRVNEPKINRYNHSNQRHTDTHQI
jgi:hypothetical protein